MILNCEIVLFLKQQKDNKKSIQSNSNKNIKTVNSYNIKQKKINILSNHQCNQYQFDQIFIGYDTYSPLFNKTLHFSNNLLYIFTNSQQNSTDIISQHFAQQFFYSCLKQLLEQSKISDNHKQIHISIFDINSLQIIDAITSKTSIQKYQIQFISQMRKILSSKKKKQQNQDLRFYRIQIFLNDRKLNQIVIMQTPRFNKFMINDQVLNMFSYKIKKCNNEIIKWGKEWIQKPNEILITMVIDEKIFSKKIDTSKKLIDFNFELKNNIQMNQMKNNEKKLKQRKTFLKQQNKQKIQFKINTAKQRNSQIIPHHIQQDKTQQFSVKQTYRKHLQNKQNIYTISNKCMMPSKSQIKYSLNPKKLLQYGSESDNQNKDNQNFLEIHKNKTNDNRKQASQRVIQMTKLKNEYQYLKIKLKKKQEQFNKQKEKLIQKHNKNISKIKQANQANYIQLEERLRSQLKQQIYDLKNELLLANDSIEKLKRDKQELIMKTQELGKQMQEENLRYVKQIKRSGQEIEELKISLDRLDLAHTKNIQKIQQSQSDLHNQNKKLKQQIKNLKCNQQKYLNQISKLQYKFLKQKGKYLAEKQNNQKLSHELEIMDQKLNQIVNLKTIEIHKLKNNLSPSLNDSSF